jgi:DNA-3-methyladenine glycosylase II
VSADPDLAKALRALSRRDPDLARARKVAGPLPDRRRDPGLATLMRIVVEQQLSVASANAIWGRVLGAAEPFTAEAFLALEDDRLRALGLSRPKAAYCRALAHAVHTGGLALHRIDAMTDEEALAHLTQVKGIGRWTAEIYLLFALGRPDIWPAHDLALQAAVHHLKGLRQRPDWKKMDRIGEAWRPYRGTAARLLWKYYAAVKAAQRAKAS